MSNSNPDQAIPKSYRRNVVLMSILIFSVGLVLTSVVLYLSVKEPIGPSYGEGFRMLSQLQDDIFYKSAIIYSVTILLVLVGIVFLSLIYSHRIAGPVYRLTCFAKTLASGDLSSPVFIRKKDVIHPNGNIVY